MGTAPSGGRPKIAAVRIRRRKVSVADGTLDVTAKVIQVPSPARPVLLGKCRAIWDAFPPEMPKPDRRRGTGLRQPQLHMGRRGPALIGPAQHQQLVGNGLDDHPAGALLPPVTVSPALLEPSANGWVELQVLPPAGTTLRVHDRQPYLVGRRGDPDGFVYRDVRLLDHEHASYRSHAGEPGFAPLRKVQHSVRVTAPTLSTLLPWVSSYRSALDPSSTVCADTHCSKVRGGRPVISSTVESTFDSSSVPSAKKRKNASTY
jgi:hypothetical protein